MLDLPIKSHRKVTRIPIRLEVFLTFKGDTWTAMTKDLSSGGLLVEHDKQRPLPLDGVVEVRVDSPYDPPPALAKVVRVEEGAVALEFIHCPSDNPLFAVYLPR